MSVTYLEEYGSSASWIRGNIRVSSVVTNSDDLQANVGILFKESAR